MGDQAKFQITVLYQGQFYAAFDIVVAPVSRSEEFVEAHMKSWCKEQGLSWDQLVYVAQRPSVA